MKLKIMGIAGVGIIVLCGLFYWYFTWSQDNMIEQAKAIAAQEIAINTLTVTLNSVKNDIKKQYEANSALSRKQNELIKESNELSRILSKHDLEHLANSKPGLVMKIINNGTAKVFKQLEDLSKIDN